ncbi:MAG: hypothetical protein RLY78_3350 [Pseudomonadota bacterium]
MSLPRPATRRPTRAPRGTAHPTVPLSPTASSATPPPATPPATAAADDAARLRRANAALFVLGFVTFWLLYCVQPLLPLFDAEFGVGAARSALALSLATGAVAVAIAASVVVAAHVDRRRLMVAALALAALCNAAVAWVDHWGALLAARTAAGLCLGAVPAVAMAYVAELVPAARLGRSMGLYVAGTALGGMAGRVGVAFVVEAAGWRAAILGVSLIGLLGVGLIAWRLPRPASAPLPLPPDLRLHLRTAIRLLREPALRRLYACGALAAGLFVTTYNYAGFRLLGAPFALSPAQAGLIFGCYLCGVAASSVAGGLADRHGPRRVLTAGLGLTALGLLVSLPAWLPGFVVGLCLLTAGFFALHAVASATVSRQAGTDRRHATALYLLAYYIGSSVFGWLGGACWEAGGWLGVSAAVGAMVVVFGGLIRTMPRPASGSRS